MEQRKEQGTANIGNPKDFLSPKNFFSFIFFCSSSLLLAVVFVDLFLFAKTGSKKFTADLWSRAGPQKSFFIFLPREHIHDEPQLSCFPSGLCGGLEGATVVVPLQLIPRIFSFQNFLFH
jgi:hypothetical protein